MFREIYPLFLISTMVLAVQLKDDHENNIHEVPTVNKVIRITYVALLTLMGITATIMFTRNIRHYQVTFSILPYFIYEHRLNSVVNLLRKKKKMITLQRDLKRFDAKFHSPESTVVESGTSRLDENINANEKQKESSIASIDSRSESSTGLEPKLTDFPTVIPSKSRSNAGQDDDINNQISTAVQKRRPGLDDVEMLRHGLINCYCVRTTVPESITLPTTANIGNTYNCKMTTAKSSNHTSMKSESVQNSYSDHPEDFHKSI